MGSFTNKHYNETVQSLVQGSQDRLKNPYYLFSNKSPTTVVYYNINYKMSTLDQGTRQVYDHVGENSPLRFNKIIDFQLYGIPRIEIDYNIGEYGVESPVEGEALILPNTVIPCIDDMFTINYLVDKPVIFRVSKVSIDTLDTGSNFYRIQYFIDRVDLDAIKYLNGKQLVNEYVYKPGNIGSNLVSVIAKGDSDTIEKLSEAATEILHYYADLFFKPSIQTFCYLYTGVFVYDPYLIEFLIRNKVYAVPDNEYYMYISQAVHTPRTFNIEYEHTIFRDIEKRNPKLRTNSCYMVPCHDPNSLLMNRMEDYFELSINLKNKPFSPPINWLNMELFDRIVNNDLYDTDDPDAPIYRNIIINWMNDKSYTVSDEELENLINLSYHPCKDLFYEIPILMFILNDIVTGLQIDLTNLPSNGNGAIGNTSAISTTNALADDITADEYAAGGNCNRTCMCPRGDTYTKPGSDDSYMTGR